MQETGVSSQRRNFDGLTSIRFIAAAAVVAHHTVGFEPGYGGVALFFVLSGYVLAHSYGERVADASGRIRFWKGRVRRIWPAHLTTMAFAIPLGLPTLGVLLANAFLLQGWVPDSKVYFSLNFVAWSLSAEAFFYLCFPFFTKVRAWQALAALLFVGIAATWATLISFDDSLAHAIFYINPLFRFPEFLLGIVLARLPLMKVRDAYLLLAWIATFAVVWIFPQQPLTFALAFLPASALTILAMAERTTGWAVSPTMVALGEASFLLYMVAQICQRYAIAIMGPGLAANLISIPIALVISYVVHHRAALLQRYGGLGRLVAKR